MKRPAIACLWVASIAATYLIVQRATTEDVAVTPKPAVRGGEIHVARLPALPRNAAVDLDVPDDRVFREVLATLERDLADGRWSVADRDRLNRGMRDITAAQASELYDVLLPKLNEGSIQSDIDGPPL